MAVIMLYCVSLSLLIVVVVKKNIYIPHVCVVKAILLHAKERHSFKKIANAHFHLFFV